MKRFAALLLVGAMLLSGCSAMAPEPTPEPTPEPSNWMIKNYVDAVGDPKDDYYLAGFFEYAGVYTDYANDERKLSVQVDYYPLSQTNKSGSTAFCIHLIDVSSCSTLFLPDDEDMYLELTIDGVVHGYDIWSANSDGKLYIDDYLREGLHDLMMDNLKRGNEITVAMESVENGDSYTFVINGVGFSELLRTL